MDTIKNKTPIVRAGKFLRGSIVATLILIFSVNAQAATEQSLYGGSGYGVMRTADLMLPGEFSYSLRASMYEYLFTGPSTEVDAISYMGISFGWGQYIEIGFSLPYQMNYTSLAAPPVAIGLQPVQFYTKLSFTGYVEQGFASSLTVYGSYVTTTPLVWVSSGLNGFGIELNFSHWSNRNGIHMNLAYETADERVESGTGAGGGSYQQVTTFKAQIGMDMYLNETMKFSFSLLGRVNDALNENVTLATGLHYIASERMTIALGTNTGFPTNRSNPQKGYFLTLTYSPNGEYKRVPQIKKDLQKVQEQNQRIENKLTTLDQKLDEMNRKLEAQQNQGTQGGGSNMADENISETPGLVSPLDQGKQSTNGIRVIVINASGEDGMGGKVADMLREKGYDVVAVDSMDEVTQQTWIHYNTGHSKTAVELDKLFAGEQHVLRRDISHADIIIIVGADQVQ